MQDWDNVRVFLGVCRNGSLTAAGRALKIDETTVGRRIKALERALGTRLFDRTAQGLVLTEAARAVRASAESAEEALLSVRGSAAGVDARPTGFVRVTATETLTTQFLIPALPEFHARYPDIQVEFFSGYIALDVARGEADIAVRALPPVGRTSCGAQARLGDPGQLCGAVPISHIIPLVGLKKGSRDMISSHFPI